MMLILGDPHIGGSAKLGKSIPGHPINSRTQDQLDLLDWVLDVAIENKISKIIITGDLFEDPRAPHVLINLVLTWCKKVISNNIGLHIIAGNHDILRYGSEYFSPLDILSHIDGINVYMDETVVNFDDEKTSILFYPFRDRKSYKADTTGAALHIVKNVLNDSIGTMKYDNKVVIGHFAVAGSVYYEEIDDITNELMIPCEFFSDYSHTIMGHIHSPQTFEYVDVIGSMDISNFGETDHIKSVILLDNNSKERISIPTRRLNEITISVPVGTEDPTEYLLDNLKLEKNLENSITKIGVSIEDSMSSNIDRKRVEEYLISQGVHNICAFSETKAKEIKKKTASTIQFDVSLESAIKKYADRYEDDIKAKFISAAFGIVNKHIEK